MDLFTAPQSRRGCEDLHRQLLIGQHCTQLLFRDAVCSGNKEVRSVHVPNARSSAICVGGPPQRSACSECLRRQSLLQQLRVLRCASMGRVIFQHQVHRHPKHQLAPQHFQAAPQERQQALILEVQPHRPQLILPVRHLHPTRPLTTLLAHPAGLALDQEEGSQTRESRLHVAAPCP